MKNNKTTVKTIRLKENIVAEVEMMAIQQNRNFNNMVETMIIQALEKSGPRV